MIDLKNPSAETLQQTSRILMSYWSGIGHVAILLVTANINEIPIIVCQFSFGMERVLGNLWP